MRKKRAFIFSTLLILTLYSCVPLPKTTQYCVESSSLEKGILQSRLLSGYVLEDNIQWYILDLNTLQEEEFDSLNKANNNLLRFTSSSNIEDIAYSIKVSPSGLWIAYSTYTPVNGYYIETLDKKSQQFIPNDNYSIVYTYYQGQKNWYLLQYKTFPLSSVEITLYPFLPTEEEKERADLYPSSQFNSDDVATNWLAYSGIKYMPTLALQSSDGKESVMFVDWEDEWQVLQGWFDNNTLLLANYDSNYYHSDSLNEYIVRYPKIILFNIFTKEKLISGNQYPKIVLSANNEWSSSLIYSPLKNYLVYLKNTNNAKRQLVVWDVAKNSSIVETPSQDILTDISPVWIDDTTIIYIARNEENNAENLFYFDIKGKLQQLTRLETSFRSPDISQLRLSQDKHFLSFWVTHETDDGKYQNNLLFLDILNSETYDFCIVNNGKMRTPERYISQGWLSSSNYFVTIPSENSTETLSLIDVLNREIYTKSMIYNSIFLGEIHP